MTDKMPPTPELDKVIEHKEEISTLMFFLEHLTFEKEIVLATWVPCFADLHETSAQYHQCSESCHLVPDRGPLYNLVLEYFGLDEETMEVERLTLLNHHRLTTQHKTTLSQPRQ